VQFFDKEVKENDRLNLMNPNKTEMRYIGLQGKWKKATPNSIKCPSIVSLAPA
jgi:hypothetical protein